MLQISPTVDSVLVARIHSAQLAEEKKTNCNCDLHRMHVFAFSIYDRHRNVDIFSFVSVIYFQLGNFIVWHVCSSDIIRMVCNFDTRNPLSCCVVMQSSNWFGLHFDRAHSMSIEHICLMRVRNYAPHWLLFLFSYVCFSSGCEIEHR